MSRLNLTEQLNTRMQQMAMSFPKPIEFEGYLIGDNNDNMNKFVLPKKLLGLDLRREDKMKLEDVTGTTSVTSTMLAVRRDTGDLGVQIVASREGAAQDKDQFFSLNQLVLDRPLSHFLPDQMVKDIFPGLNRNQITNDMLAEAVRNNRRLLSHTYFDNGNPGFTVDYMPKPINVDMFGARRSLHPTNEFMVGALLKNKYDGGNTFGLSHIHYGYSPNEIDQDDVLTELSNFDKKFPRLITPEDAVQLINSVPTIRTQSKGRLDNAGMGLIGVTALDPNDYKIIGSSFFDLIELSKDKNERDFDSFERLAVLANNTADIGVIKDFFSLIKQYSPPKLPEYVVSIDEDSASSPITSIASNDRRSSSPVAGQ